MSFNRAPQTQISRPTPQNTSNISSSTERDNFDWVKNFEKLVKKPPPFSKFQSFIHDEVFISGKCEN